MFLIFLEAFLTIGPFETNISLALLHSWALFLVIFFARFNAGEASLMKKREEEVILGREKTIGSLKDEFVYIISHELKQPAMAIKGYIGTILSKYSTSLNPDASEVLNLTNANSDRLSKLLEDLLDISQIEKGSLRIKMADVALRPIVSEVLSNLLIDAQNKRISLVQKGNEEIAAKADVDRLKEILTNLVGNAVKYTPEGGKIVVEVKKEGSFAKILVSDNGVGISEEDQKHLFEKFHRVENEETKAVKGSGLGLFIAKQLVEKMGGRIGVTSTVGQGTTFYFTLPRYRW
jgi:two-component system phosphate regulon sensor histidine kinase PhoR